MNTLEREFIAEVLADKSNASMLYRAKINWEEKRDHYKAMVREFATLVSHSDTKVARLIAKSFFEKYKKWLAMAEGHISRLTWQRKVCLGRAKQVDIDVSEVKQVPIGQFMGSPGQSYGNRVKYKCPLHREKTPSFVWYKDQNSWWCYGGCGGGDNIDLYMKLNNVSFKEAIEKLSTTIC